MEIQITLVKEDWRAAQKYIKEEMLKNLNAKNDSVWVSIFMWIAVALILLAVYKSGLRAPEAYRFNFHWPTAIFTSFVFVAIFLFVLSYSRKLIKTHEPNNIGIFCGDHTFHFNEYGITSEGKGYKQNHSWEIVKK